MPFPFILTFGLVALISLIAAVREFRSPERNPTEVSLWLMIAFVCLMVILIPADGPLPP